MKLLRVQLGCVLSVILFGVGILRSDGLAKQIDSIENEKVWIYLNTAAIPRDAEHRIAYPDRTVRRLRKNNWETTQTGPGTGDYVLRKADLVHIKPFCGKIYFFSRSLSAISASVPRDKLDALARLDEVLKIERVRVLAVERPVLPFSVADEKMIAKSDPRSDFYGVTYGQLQQLNIPAVHESGLSGKGVRIALFDSGFFKNHEVFDRLIQDGRLIAERDFIFGDNNVQDETAEDSTYEGNQQFHGGEVWSIIAGYKPYAYVGVAYDAEFLLAKTERLGSETQIEEDMLVAGVEWADSLGADIMSTSLGYRDFDGFVYPFTAMDGQTTPAARAVNWAFERGILFVASAGNEANNRLFPDGGISTPGDALGTLTVGAVDENSIIAGFSSYGPTFDGRTKPDLCARGVRCRVATEIGFGTYGSRAGTSYSAPLITGAAALILEKYPHWCPAEIIAALKNFSSLAATPDQVYGWGIPDVYRSIYESVDSDFPLIGNKVGEITAFPNPANSSVNLFFQWGVYAAAGDDPVELMIFDMLGRKVYGWDVYPSGRGMKYVARWDMKDTDGAPVPSGIYIMSLSSKKELKMGRLTVIR